jgi:hypothetical protein
VTVTVPEPASAWKYTGGEKNAPAGVETVSTPLPAPVRERDTMRRLGSELVNVTGRLPAGAATGSAAADCTCRSLPTVALLSVIGAPTLIAAVAWGMPVALARNVVLPVATPWTEMTTDVCPPGIVVVAGTVAMLGWSVVRFTRSPPMGAVCESRSVMSRFVFAPSASVVGVKLSASLTVTLRRPGANPGAFAVISVVPRP